MPSYVLLAFFCLAGPAPSWSMCDSAVPGLWFASGEQCETFAAAAHERLVAAMADKGVRVYAYRHVCIPVAREVGG